MFAKLEKSSPTEVSTQMDINEAEKLLFNLIQNSKYHIDMTILTCNCLIPLVTERLSNYLKTAINQGVKVRILIPNDERSLELKNSMNLNNSNNIEVKQINWICNAIFYTPNIYLIIFKMKSAFVIISNK